jgi:Ca-activated chloride channel family protein
MTKSLNVYALCIALFISVSCENSARLGKSGNSYYPMTEEKATYESAEEGYAERDLKPQEPPTEKEKQKVNTEEYDKITENPFQGVAQNPVSTFSIDVDNASYSNVRRHLNSNSLPPSAAVRIEEMINYFDYDYPQPKGKDPFSINTEISSAPWNKEHHLIHIGLQGKDLDYDNIKPSNLVFLIDASGSMSNENKLPLLKKGLKILLNELDDKDKVSIVAYAGAAGLVLPATPASDRNKILRALDGVESGGSTAGGEGIQLAYKIAKENLIEGGNNRVILATDGDFNVGVSSSAALVDLIEEKRKDNIFLTICGLGMGNYKDGRMEQISNAGNGNYFYIDNIREAEKVFSKEMRANMFTIAKDVKIQIEFNPNTIKAYRLIGYENRMLAKEDFDDDTKDAGELGAGHTVTAIYEVILADSKSEQQINTSADLKYQTVVKSDNKSDLMTVKFRYKAPTSDLSTLIEQVLPKGNIPELSTTSDNFRFSASVAAFGMLLRDSEFKGEVSYDMVSTLAKAAVGPDTEGYRSEFIQLVKTAALLDQNDPSEAVNN